jgi:hypothetical protein
VADYKFWRSRLLILEKEFQDSSPRTMRQWWHDRRRWRDWATFWVAFVALILALASVLSGMISAILAGYSWKEAKVANTYASIASSSASSSAKAGSNSSSTPNCCYPVACYTSMTMASNYTIQRSSESTASTIMASTLPPQVATFTEVVTTTEFVTTTISFSAS